MRKNLLGLGVLGFVLFFLVAASRKPQPNLNNTSFAKPQLATDSIYSSHINKLYGLLHLQEAGLSLPVFEKAVTGFYNLKQSGCVSNKDILSIADFDQVSTKKRLYIIDLDKKALLLNTWVAHGQNSGGNEATKFSNLNNSYTSSLGFYITGEVYRGIHGKSLKLDGMDAGFNSNARSRAIVVHGAPYVSNNTIKALGRLGRSQGCPAVAPAVAEKVIQTIEDKTVLFIHKSDESYNSKYLNETLAANFAVDLQTNFD